MNASVWSAMIAAMASQTPRFLMPLLPLTLRNVLSLVEGSGAGEGSCRVLSLAWEGAVREGEDVCHSSWEGQARDPRSNIPQGPGRPNPSFREEGVGGGF